MLDENLPFFSIKSSNIEHPLNIPILLREKGSEFRPKYTLRKPDPALPTSKNCYAIALYDSYFSEILYAQVLVEPEWISPIVSTVENRAQTNTSFSQVPVVPKSFVIQLHNPDHQVVVRQKPGKWNNSACWKYEMPQHSFRIPSSSALDRSLNPPALNELTPKISFKWKRDGKFSRDIVCYLVCKSSDGKKSKEPDITIAYFKSGKGLTIYQPNMHRVEIEDTKGFEYVLLLSAVVIKDIFFNVSREMFNITSLTDTASESKSKPEVARLTNSATRILSSKNLGDIDPLFSNPSLAPQPTNTIPSSTSLTSKLTRPGIDIETERLKQILAAEEILLKETEAAEERQTKEMLRTEETERRRKEAEIEKETERLRKQYGVIPITSPTSSSFQENKLLTSRLKKFSGKNISLGIRVPSVSGYLDSTGRREDKHNHTSLSSSSRISTTPCIGNEILTLIQKVQKKKSQHL